MSKLLASGWLQECCTSQASSSRRQTVMLAMYWHLTMAGWILFLASADQSVSEELELHRHHDSSCLHHSDTGLRICYDTSGKNH